MMIDHCVNSDFEWPVAADEGALMWYYMGKSSNAVTGLKWYYPLGYCLQLMALPYFAFQPNLAASWAHSFIVDANAQMIQAAWSPMMNKVAVPSMTQ